ncbi:MAG: cupin domain-containing protein, partial [Oleibacter sp.]|nr:cupin domain-containing protein [Thalassolituus sp.]
MSTHDSATPHTPISVLGQLSIDEFLRDYWQKKPLLIRNAWPNFIPLLPADELAGLSLEDDIETRLVVENGESGSWQVKKGPFTESDYQALPKDKWTLLVQGVDQWLPQAAALLDHFRFIPSWRLDDLMISYAVDGGSVGPHYDQYDVFLLQAEGQREWRIGQSCNNNSPLLSGTDLRILANFNETESWVLNPGDMLYLPPLWAHYGRSIGECMTYSIGFRAPSSGQLLERTVDAILPKITEDSRYHDEDLTALEAGAEISAKAIARLRKLIIEQLNDDQTLAQVLGQLLTEAKYPEYAPPAPELNNNNIEPLAASMQGIDTLTRSLQSRFAWHQQEDDIVFFTQGEAFHLSKS